MRATLFVIFLFCLLPFYFCLPLLLPSENSVAPRVESDGGQARRARSRGAFGRRRVRLQRFGRVGRDVCEGRARGRFDRADEGLRGEVDGDDQLFARAAPQVT